MLRLKREAQFYFLMKSGDIRPPEQCPHTSAEQQRAQGPSCLHVGTGRALLEQASSPPA